MSNTRLVLIVAAFMALGLNARAQAVYWSALPSLPNGGVTLKIARSPAGTLIAARDNEISRSTDNGSHWLHLMPGNTNDILWNSGYFWLSSNDGILRSSDEGATWIPFSPKTGMYASLCANQRGMVVAALVYDSFYVSIGGGAWRKLDTVFSNGQFALGNDSTIYQVGTHCGLPMKCYWSHDLGSHWDSSQVNSGSLLVRRLVITRAGVLFSTVNGGIMRSSDHGQSWQVVSRKLPLADYFAITEDAQGRIYTAPSGKIFTTAAGMIYRSLDTGLTWQIFSETGVRANIYDLSIDSSGNNMIAAADCGALRTLDGGASWQVADSGMIASVRTTANSPNGTLLAGTESGIYESTDNGRTWLTRCDTEVSRSFAVAQGGNVYAAGLESLMHSSDAGHTWTSIPSPPSTTHLGDTILPSDISLLAAVQNSPMLVAGTYDSGVWMTSNNGATWTRAPLVKYGLVRSMAMYPNGKILVGFQYSSEAMQSTDWGQTWRVFSAEGQGGTTVVGVAEVGDTMVLARDWDINKTGVHFFLHDDPTQMHWANGGPWVEFISQLVQAPNGDIFTYSPNGIVWSNKAGSFWQQVTKDSMEFGTVRILNSGHWMRWNAEGIWISNDVIKWPFYPSPGDAVQQEAEGWRIAIYPNPGRSNSSVFVENADGGYITLSIVDLLGRAVRTVYSGELEPGQRSFEMPSGLSAGAYYLQWHLPNHTIGQTQFVIE